MKPSGLTVKRKAISQHIYKELIFSFSISQNEFWSFLEFCILFVLFMHGGQMAESERINSTPKLSMYCERAPLMSFWSSWGRQYLRCLNKKKVSPRLDSNLRSSFRQKHLIQCAIPKHAKRTIWNVWRRNRADSPLAYHQRCSPAAFVACLL